MLDLKKRRNLYKIRSKTVIIRDIVISGNCKNCQNDQNLNVPHCKFIIRFLEKIRL